jgi:hypothetical protein
VHYVAVGVVFLLVELGRLTGFVQGIGRLSVVFNFGLPLRCLFLGLWKGKPDERLAEVVLASTLFFLLNRGLWAPPWTVVLVVIGSAFLIYFGATRIRGVSDLRDWARNLWSATMLLIVAFILAIVTIGILSR